MDPLPSSKPFQKYSWSVTDKEGEYKYFVLGLHVGSDGDGREMFLLLELRALEVFNRSHISVHCFSS